VWRESSHRRPVASPLKQSRSTAGRCFENPRGSWDGLRSSVILSVLFREFPIFNADLFVVSNYGLRERASTLVGLLQPLHPTALK